MTIERFGRKLRGKIGTRLATYEARLIATNLTMPQRENLVAIAPYIHGSPHGYGQDGPIRRRLAQRGLIEPFMDGWVATKLGLSVVAAISEFTDVQPPTTPLRRMPSSQPLQDYIGSLIPKKSTGTRPGTFSPPKSPKKKK
jgi:hypothetical protein